ncbi:ArdC family protein [Halomonas kalidii]|uniref:Zincin-like metallopeptidase domain-containing protein n=1 Tax=Halomonas kalidii TaxID=3043293 RepID=A0ABT6VDY3_9GAMM|nr:zincin-like metallopeptidase domain-containing protein [Halomonas kalidii]MDI5932205.1 zincin-like metallopeptidase domain-containing protein [Halomonas kalidii]
MDLYQQITDQFINALEQGTVSWVKPWNNTSEPLRMPMNASTGRQYSDVNVLLLWAAAMSCGYPRHRWLTFKQALDAGGNVRKGEKSTLVCFFKPMKRQVLDEAKQPVLDEDGEPLEESFSIMKGLRLFNVAQCEGVPESISGMAGEVAPEFEPSEEADRILNASDAQIDHVEGDRAFYNPVADRIQLPLQSQFDEAIGYYGTALHELVHWTGHRDRLDRDGIARWSGFGSPEYAKEELIAELGAAFLCAHAGIPGELRHEGYIENWLEALKGDKRYLFQASSAARKASEYLLDSLPANHR